MLGPRHGVELFLEEQVEIRSDRSSEQRGSLHRALTSLARGLIESIALLSTVIINSAAITPVSHSDSLLSPTVPLGKPVQDAWTPSRVESGP
jgi:hypothetical protein